MLLCIFCAGLLSCNSKDNADTTDETQETKTPVTVTSVSYEPIKEYIELNATSSFLQKNYIKANLNGYVQKVNVKFGDYVHIGQTLFVLKTKEAEAIGNAVNKLDPGFNFSGINYIKANSNGYIEQLDHQAGDYVQDGDQLAVISDSKSFVFVMNVPYEDRQYVSIGKDVEIIFPDKERINGTISSALPMVDSISQTQSFSVKVNLPHSIPENLIAKARIVKVSKAATATLPKESVLSDETQADFWVMKLMNDSTAVKVPVKKGIETEDKVEIVSPEFSPNDKILLTGNYGLPDTAGVIVHK